MNKFVIMYCNEGLECIFDITDFAHDTLVAKLAGNPDPRSAFNLSMMIVRARANSQRHYEIYALDTDNSIDENCIREMFNTDPQFIVDLIRSKGSKIFSDRVEKNKICIV